MSYWSALTQARSLLSEGEILRAEASYDTARELREQSPGRVFLSETMGDAARRAWRNLRGHESSGDPGRWERACGEFRSDFRATARALLTDAESLLGGRARPEDLPLLSEAAGVLSRSALVETDAERAAPLLLAALASARAAGTLPASALVPPPGFLPEPDAVRTADMVRRLLRDISVDSAPARDLADRAAALLEAQDDAAAGRQGHRRGDLRELAARPEQAAADYLAYLRCTPPGEESREEIVLRAIALLANLERHSLPVPRYVEALELTAAARPGSPAAELAARVRRRLPQRGACVWAVTTRRAARWWVVLWADDRALDVAWWDEGGDDTALRDFLAPCAGRILSLDSGGPWPAWNLPHLLDVLLEDGAAPEGLREHSFTPEGRSHPSLRGSGVPAGVPAVLAAGAAWSSLIRTLAGGDPALRTGVHTLARLGDAPAKLLSSFLPPELVPSTGWPLTPLSERTAPRLPAGPDPVPGGDPMADLAQADDAVVTSGRADRVLAAWGGRRERWRIVLDRPERLRELGGVLELRGGKRTVLPDLGAVDDPDAALADLEALAADPDRDPRDLLPLLHWFRISRTHNGDLTDGLDVGTGGSSGAETRGRYRRWLTVRRRERREGAGRWLEELSVRAAASAVVVGLGMHLSGDRTSLANCWGLPESVRGAWVLCDASVLLWRRLRTRPAEDDPLPLLLRSLADGVLLINTAAVFRRGDLEAAQAAWLGDDDVLRRAATDVRPPLLELAGDQPGPDARVALGALAASYLDHAELQTRRGAEVTWYLSGAPDPLAAVLKARADGLFGDVTRTPRAATLAEVWDGAAPVAQVAVIPRLESLDGPATPSMGSDPFAWRGRDLRRREALPGRARRLALELNAWLARGAETVTVGDSRWWREFPPRDEDGEPGIPLGAERARHRQAGDAAILWSSTPSVGDVGRAGRSWLRDQGWLEPDGDGLPAGYVAIPVDAGPPLARPPAAGLYLGAPDVPWFHLLREARRWAEAGPEDAWLLVIADEPPPGAAELAAAGEAPRASVGEGEGPFTPGPLVWVRPSALRDPALRRRLAVARPTAVWVSDLRRWLPSDHGAGLEYVGVLRFLLRDLDGRVLLHASHLPGPWRGVLTGLLGRGAGTAPVRAVPQSTKVAPPVSLVRGAEIVVACPGCDERAPLRGAGDHCPSCGLDLLRWLPAAVRAALPDRLRALKVEALRRRQPGDAAAPLCVWAPSREADAWTAAFDAAGISWRRIRRRSLSPEDQDGAWLLCLLDDQPEVPSECRHALLVAPQDEQELADLRQRCGSELQLCHHPLDGALADTGVGRQRLRMDHCLPLRAAELGPPMELTPPWTWDGLLTPRLQEIISGSPAALVRRATGALSWLAAVEGESEPATPRPPDEDSPVPQLSRMELEYRAERVDALVAVLLPALLSDLPPGGVGAVDLAALPLDLDQEDLAWCDRFLLAASLRLAEPGVQLLYEPDGGLRHGTLRRLGCLGSPTAVVEALSRHRDARIAALAARLADEAVSRDGLPLDLLEAGVLLGAWRLEGVPRDGDLPATPATVVEQRLRPDLRKGVADLLRGLSAERSRWRDRLDEAWHIGFLEDVPRVLPAPASPPELPAPERTVTELETFLDRSVSGLRLLEGYRGSGRVDAVVAALARACARGLVPRRITVVTPDRAAAARFHRLWRQALPDGDAPETVVGPQGLPVTGRLDPALAPSGEPAPVTVVLGLESLPSTLRYRLANRAREQRLILVLEPLLLQESREHLLPARPEANQVLHTDRLRATARNLRDDLADLANGIGPGLVLPRTTRSERGVCESMRVAGLDDALARVDDRLRDLALTTPVELVAPVLSDLETLGRSAARLGWLPVYGWELDTLRLPGVWEFLLAVCDAAQPTSGDDSWLAACLGPAGRREADAWFSTYARPDLRLHEFWALLSRARWADGLFHGPRETARIAALILAAGDDTLVRYAARPLLEVWRLATGESLGRADATPSGPALTLTTPERAGEDRRRAVVYLCTGREADRQHYAMLSRADDVALSLYQDLSPLPRERGDL